MRSVMRSVWGGAGVVAVAALLGGCTSVKNLYGDLYGSVMGSSSPAPAAGATVSPLPAAVASVPAMRWHERWYVADISAARAYVAQQRPVNQRMALVDVRDATEYRLGHPEGARHLPYPRLYQACQPHPSGAAEAPVRNEDGSACRYGAAPQGEVQADAAQWWASVEAALPYKDAPLAVLGRTGAHGAQVANLLARPDLVLGKDFEGKGYQQVYNVWEGYVGVPLVAQDAATLQVLTAQAKPAKVAMANTQVQWLSVQPAPLDLDGDRKLTPAEYSGWRYYQGLPFVTSVLPSLRSELAQPYYERP